VREIREVDELLDLGGQGFGMEALLEFGRDPDSNASQPRTTRERRDGGDLDPARAAGARSDGMKRSVARILTTQAGSLPRPTISSS